MNKQKLKNDLFYKRDLNEIHMNKYKDFSDYDGSDGNKRLYRKWYNNYKTEYDKDVYLLSLVEADINREPALTLKEIEECILPITASQDLYRTTNPNIKVASTDEILHCVRQKLGEKK